MGYVSFSELKNIKVGGWLEVDFDLYWEPNPASKLIKLNEPTVGQRENVMCCNGDFFDDGIGAEELGMFLGISEELKEEEEAKQLDKDNEPLTPDEILETPFDGLDEEDI